MTLLSRDALKYWNWQAFCLPVQFPGVKWANQNPQHRYILENIVQYPPLKVNPQLKHAEPMPKQEQVILSIETATAVCSVALIQAGQVIGSEFLETKQRHNEVLPLIINKLFLSCDCKYHQLCALAVSIGPGSFTGLRVGLSFAKGVAVGLGISIIPVNTLDALALTMSKKIPDGKKFLPTVVARRGELFGCLYGKTANSEISEAIGDVFMGGAEKFSDLNGSSVNIGGAGIDALVDLSPEMCSESMKIIKGITAKAESVGIIGYRKWINNPENYRNYRDLEPQYLKEFTVKTRKKQ